MKAIACKFATISVLFWISLLSASSYGAGVKLIDNSSDPNAALITLPLFSISPPGRWTIVITQSKSAYNFQSIDGAQRLQVAVVDIHPKPKETEDQVFHDYVDARRSAEHENIENKALVADAIKFSTDGRGVMASWCIVDQAGSTGHLSASLQGKRKILSVSYDAEKVSESEFRERAEQVMNSMTLH